MEENIPGSKLLTFTLGQKGFNHTLICHILFPQWEDPPLNLLQCNYAVSYENRIFFKEVAPL